MTPFPLSEWALMLNQAKLIKLGNVSNLWMAIKEVWKKVQKMLIPGQSLTASVLSHTGFQAARWNLDFGE